MSEEKGLCWHCDTEEISGKAVCHGCYEELKDVIYELECKYDALKSAITELYIGF